MLFKEYFHPCHVMILLQEWMSLRNVNYYHI